LSESTVSVILPVHNQADHIEQIASSYVEVLANAKVDYEMLLIVNGCRDDSRSVCDGMAATNPAIRVFEENPGGWGKAVKRGIAEATGDLICYTNSARTTERELILAVLYARAFPDTIVKANRRIRESLPRRAGSLLYNLECRFLFDLSAWDVNGTPKVFPRAYAALLNLTSDNDLIDAEFNAICRRNDYPMIEIPIFSTRRHGGKSTTNWRSAFKMYVGAVELRRRLERK
jgi:glycosyltransferase involved in cell wall biosynthesis